MDSPKRKSKFKIWIKNLFSKRPKSSKKSKRKKNETIEEEIKLVKALSLGNKVKKYTYLKNKQQEIYYANLKRKFDQMPKKKEIKKPRIKKNQEGNLFFFRIKI
jgi:hypothetical protein